MFENYKIVLRKYINEKKLQLYFLQKKFLIKNMEE